VSITSKPCSAKATSPPTVSCGIGLRGQVTAIKCGILSFEAVFMPFMLGSDGHPLVEKMKSQLPAPHDGNVVELKAQQP
jgi:hypothetical protein